MYIYHWQRYILFTEEIMDAADAFTNMIETKKK